MTKSKPLFHFVLMCMLPEQKGEALEENKFLCRKIALFTSVKPILIFEIVI
jgi:hypothetical protein